MVSVTLSVANTVVPGMPMSRSIETICATWRSRLWMPIDTSTRRSRTRMESMEWEIIESLDDADRDHRTRRLLPRIAVLRGLRQQGHGPPRPTQLRLEEPWRHQCAAHGKQGRRGAD